MKIHYKITLEDGTIAEDTFAGEPVDLNEEDGLFPAEIDSMLQHIDIDMTYDHILKPENGWGLRDPENIHKLPIDDFEAYADLTEGMILNFDLPNGDSIPGAIVNITAGQVFVDFNHPYAGQTLHFHIKRTA
jgi:FKBP-type peptidyl-prolyl cis-trans isomerase SlpA